MAMLEPRGSVPETQVRRRRKVVATTFHASLVAFFGVGCYDYFRPFAHSNARQIAHETLCFIDESIASQSNETNNVLVDILSSPLYNEKGVANLVLCMELLFLVPALLFILPLTERWRSTHLTTHQTMEQMKTSGSNHQDYHTTSMEINFLKRVVLLLSIISWALWVVSASLLLLGVFVGPRVFGIISLAALLSFFAQTVNGIGCLMHRYEDNDLDDDDLWKEAREAKSAMESPTRTVPANTWVGIRDHIMNDKKTSPKIRTHACTDDLIESSVSNPRNPKSETHTSTTCMRNSTLAEKLRECMTLTLNWVTHDRNLDFALFFLMKIALLQTPYFLQIGLHLLTNCVDCLRSSKDAGMLEHSLDGIFSSPNKPMLAKGIFAAFAFSCTILVPLFTHGVGGRMFHGKQWSFHHPFRGGKHHVTSQASGWSLFGVAGLLHLAFIFLGMESHHVYLMHSGSALSWFAEALLLYSLRNFDPEGKQPTIITESKLGQSKEEHNRSTVWMVMSYLQDILLTNLHWWYTLWVMASLVGFDAFSLAPTRTFLNASLVDLVVIQAKMVCCLFLLPTLMIPYSPKRKQWRWNPFGLVNDLFEWFVFHPKGLFFNSKLRMELPVEEYQRSGAMFAMLPHGILPTSVGAVWYQFDSIFETVCLFFGSQISLCPGYRFFLGMRGGCLPVERKRVVEVMKTGQNVSLVPGGVSEMLKCVPRGKNMNVSIKHKGFVRLAIQEGYDLIPTFFFHANDQYDNPMGHLQLLCYKFTGVPLGIPLFTNSHWLPMSNRTQIRVALGDRIHVTKNASPTQEQVDNLHRIFYEEVHHVWNKYKDEFGYGDRELAYVT